MPAASTDATVELERPERVVRRDRLRCCGERVACAGGSSVLQLGGTANEREVCARNGVLDERVGAFREGDRARRVACKVRSGRSEEQAAPTFVVCAC